jgi:hypothetical protein
MAGGIVARGVSWKRTGGSVALCAALLPALFGAPRHTAPVSVIVRAVPGMASQAERAVLAAGGAIGRRFGIIDSFEARIPAGAPLGSASILSVVPNSSLHLLNTNPDDVSGDAGSMSTTAKVVGASDLWRAGFTGKGVDVALIDSGVVPVNGLTTAGKIVNGPDLSFESQGDSVRYLDTYGHGTHMAGIIAGKDNPVASSTTSAPSFSGIAPDARIVSVKVANAVGATDVSQVLAAIDWVVQHRTDNGMNIRVLNLSFGTNGTQAYTIDPLAYAAEVAWRKGIVVVVAAGNDGKETGGLDNPAYDPYLISVGADDPKGTVSTGDDSIPTWSSRGDGTRNPDVVAPGKSIISLLDSGSYIDQTYGSTGRVGTRYFRGSGTSQATAVVSGAAALLLQQRPSLTPDQVKKLLTSTANKLSDVSSRAQGAGLVDLKSAADARESTAKQTFALAKGTGSLESARGGAHVQDSSGNELRGEQDIFGKAWDGTSWSGTSWSGTSWSGGTWNGSDWAGTGWSGTSWSGTSWSGTSWSGTSWSGTSWSGTSWSGTSWSGTSWSGTSWSGTSWSGTSWSGTSWSGGIWNSSIWGGDA